MASTFTNIPLKVVPPPDPHKYVNYTLGMLLGVDDFMQEHTYLSGYDHWLTRELLGYGTASGLQISVEADEQRGPRVLVEPGVAVSPRGQLIRVTPTQCAYLNDWLTANQQQLGKTPKSPLTIYVVLSYRACATDTVPIAGEPCRSEDSLMASSRLSDDFTLELSLTPPDQVEEAALRAFVAWLRQVEIGDPATTDAGAFTTLEQFAGAIRKAAQQSDPASPTTFMSNNPPDGLLISADLTCDYWQTAFGIWTLELRPNWRPQAGTWDIPDEDGLLLAELSLPLKEQTDGSWQADTSRRKKNAVGVNEQNRPRLVHLRLLQEWMLCGRRETPPSALVIDEVLFGQEPDKGSLNSYSRGDHTHGTPPLAGDAVSNDDGTVTVQGLQNIPIDPTPPTNRQILRYNDDQKLWQLADLDDDDDRRRRRRDDDDDDRRRDDDDDTQTNRGGDVVQDQQGNTTVQALQHFPLANTAPTPGQILMYSDEQWQPTYLAERPDMVERPRGLGRYAIVAAGYVRCNRTSQETSYNGLIAETLREGIVRVRFNGYSNERIQHLPYVVKVLAGWHDQVRPCIVQFDRFLKDFFVLRVTDGNGNPISKENLEQLDLMIEVSEYELLAPAESNGNTGHLSRGQG
jgi:hypothetical protein